MPRQQKLKVYRTPVGFHDAYVAAPSQKAALRTWGSDSDLFAQKIAEQVTDPKLMKEPLAHPGEIIRKLRGTIDEQFEALGSKGARKAAKKPAKSKPKPSRADMARAEQDLQDIRQRQAGEIKALDAQLTALEVKLADTKRANAIELEAAERRLENEANDYERAIKDWDSS